MEKPGMPWSVPVAVKEISDTGLHLKIEAPSSVRAEVANLAGVRELPQLSAVFDLDRQGARVQVTGQVSARVGQTCVVTLEPMECQVEEAVNVVFAPSLATDAKEGDDEPPEPLVDGKVDLGALATEFLLLGIDPYPRKLGAEFALPKVENGGEHPFTALETLKKLLGNGQP
jgi:uncharacterized metal-binding protein YceD (DUF177 family)